MLGQSIFCHWPFFDAFAISSRIKIINYSFNNGYKTFQFYREDFILHLSYSFDNTRDMGSEQNHEQILYNSAAYDLILWNFNNLVVFWLADNFHDINSILKITEEIHELIKNLSY